MKLVLLIATLAQTLGAAIAATPQAFGGGPAIAFAPSSAAFAQDDAWDIAYREARQALDRDELDRAAKMFATLRDKYPKSPRAGDAAYWEAFARYRLGGEANLQAARVALDAQRKNYPDASTRRDAQALLTRIRGLLARSGDAASAEAVVGTASQLAALAPLDGRTSTTISSATATTASRGGRSSLPEGCKDEDVDERIEALNALMHVDADRAVPILKKVLARRDLCAAPLRRKAVFVLVQKKQDGTEDILLDLIKNDPDREVREQAVFWLSQVGTTRSAEALEQVLNDSHDTGLQKKAVFALSQLKLSNADDRLMKISTRSDLPIEVRSDAIFFLGQRSGGAAQVKTLYAQLDDPRLREKALFAVGQSSDAGAGAWILEIARNPKETMELRKKALFWASQSRAVSMEDLAAFYQRDADRELKEQYVFALSQRRESTAVERLVDIAKGDPDREVRKKAVFWLSQSRDPRAVKYLEELLDK